MLSATVTRIAPRRAPGPDGGASAQLVDLALLSVVQVEVTSILVSTELLSDLPLRTGPNSPDSGAAGRATVTVAYWPTLPTVPD